MLLRRQRAHPVIAGRRATLYGWLSALGLGWLYRTVACRVLDSFPAGGTVLDVGTGPGRLLKEIAIRRPDARCVGIDPSQDMVRAATGRSVLAEDVHRIEVVVAGAEHLPFPDDTFDAVVSTLSSHHWADVQQAVAEQARVLRPGGRLWVVDLRPVQPATVATCMAARWPTGEVSHSTLGRAAGAAFVCLVATKPADRQTSDD